MSTIKYHFGKDDCPSFGGASLSNARLEVLVMMYNYLESQKDNYISSKDIQNNVSHNDNDTRSVIAILKKLGFTNLNDDSLKACDFYTPKGKALMHIVLALRMVDPTQKAYGHIMSAFHKLLQEGIINFCKVPQPSNLGFRIILYTIGIIKHFTFEEYAYALYLWQHNKSFEDIAENILTNRTNSVTYEFTKDIIKGGVSIESPLNGSILQSTQEMLQQAGIIDKANNLISLEFLRNNNLPIL